MSSVVIPTEVEDAVEADSSKSVIWVTNHPQSVNLPVAADNSEF